MDAQDKYLALSTYVAILHRQLQRDMNQLLVEDKLPVNMTEIYLMVLIMETDGVNQRQAATTLAVDEGLMTRMVKHLVSLGFIEKTASAEDKRNKLLTLTVSGEKLLDHGLARFRKWWETFINDVDGLDIQKIGSEVQQISKAVVQNDTLSNQVDANAIEK
ncbi:transcriptional regulator [Secundilactobacillus oryzae JCM 18671]|uniref:Transcriptional regulator n=1 Tax=Secundilactobacillus oryzae JCM 18671 TaxID=1291743 RepID=A0A081BL18_9LACO|nr:MarR family transcriptional regulator [Secundilactobacillus oryzae]GAK48736.1 transcriptional regulator [Secundilactobacillus oryzae JCM 18671]